MTGPSSVEGVRELVSGVDAFYMSGRPFADGAGLAVALFEELGALKAAAAESQDPVHFSLAGEEFVVRPYGQKPYPFVLRHANGLLKLTASEKVPTVRVEPLSLFLHSLGTRDATRWFQGLVESAAGGAMSWSVSRLDLYVDVQGWFPVPDDRLRMVCRSTNRELFEVNDSMTGIEIGRRESKTLCARVYDKTAEVARFGHDHWYELWGERFDPTLPVWRFEVEIHRSALVQLGVDRPEQALDRLGGVWAYCTEDWIRLAIPSKDATRARWRTDPVWKAIQSASLRGDAVALTRLRAARGSGSARKMMPGLTGLLSSFGAALGCTSMDETIDRLIEWIEEYCYQRGRSFPELLASKQTAL